jgi:hypothetical protein
MRRRKSFARTMANQLHNMNLSVDDRLQILESLQKLSEDKKEYTKGVYQSGPMARSAKP